MITLIIYTHFDPSWKWSNRPHKRDFVVSYLFGSTHYAIRQLCPRAGLHCIHQGLTYVLKDGSPKELGQVTLVAKQPDPAVQSSSFENVNWEMQLPAYQNEGLRQLAAATAPVWCEERHLTALAAHLSRNVGENRMSSALQVQMARWLGFQ
jgi:hypothetical protein